MRHLSRERNSFLDLVQGALLLEQVGDVDTGANITAKCCACSEARRTLIERIYKPLQNHSTELLTTLWCYLDNGRSLEATARELFVHPNTVRYRLKRISEVIGWDATGAREALILQSALIVGSIAENDRKS